MPIETIDGVHTLTRRSKAKKGFYFREFDGENAMTKLEIEAYDGDVDTAGVLVNVVDIDPNNGDNRTTKVTT